jgi:hypothetical protein
MDCNEARIAIWNILKTGQRTTVRKDPHSPVYSKPYPAGVIEHLEQCEEGCKEWESNHWESGIKSGEIAVHTGSSMIKGTPAEVLNQIATEIGGYTIGSITSVIDTYVMDRMMENGVDDRDWPYGDPEAVAIRYFKSLKSKGELGRFLDPDGLLD